MSQNNRIYWAVKSVAIAPYTNGTAYVNAKGVQSLGASLDFDLIQAYELGQSALYENIEKIPDVSLTMEKLFDGTPPLYHLCTRGFTSNNLQGRANQRCNVAIGLFSELNSSASGAQVAEITHSGFYLSSFQAQFPVDGNFSESVTLVGNNRTWRTSGFVYTGGFLNTDVPVLASGGVQRREDFIWDCGASPLDSNGQVISNVCTILPTNIAGISTSGTNSRDSNGNYACSVENASISLNLGRDAIYELGHKAPYFRFANFPVEVTSEFTVISKSGDNVSATEIGILGGINAGNNLSNQTISLYLREGSYFNLGTSNKLSNIGVTGADVGGGLESLTYKYITFDSFVFTNPSDPG